MSESSQDTPRNIPSPKVAVIIPCFNHGNYVQEAILSVAKQDYALKSVFLSDEGSTDDSWDKVNQLFEHKTEGPDGVTIGRVQNLMVVASQNPKPRGPSAARNRLIQMAWHSSDMFAMLDADDYYLPNKISKSVSVLTDDPDTVRMAYTDAIIYNEKTKVKIREYREPYSRYRLEEECIVSNTPVITKKAFETAGLYDETMRTAEDWDLWLRITETGIAIHIPEALHVYRVTGKNASDVVPVSVWNQNWEKIRQRIHGNRH